MTDWMSAILPFVVAFLLVWFLVSRLRLAPAQKKHLELIEQSVETSANIARHLDRIATALENRKP
ncbi:MAG: hypothetical protein NTW20_16780 [Rhodobacterales bacterium]|nr:hypothetical protein [Rhodobacterales bacterium]